MRDVKSSEPPVKLGPGDPYQKCAFPRLPSWLFILGIVGVVVYAAVAANHFPAFGAGNAVGIILTLLMVRTTP